MSGTTPSGSGEPRAAHRPDAPTDGHDDVPYPLQALHLILHGLPAFLLLVALTIVVEHKQLVPRADAFFASVVTQKGRLPDESDAVVNAAVTVVEISAPLRLKHFEAMDDMDASTAGRMEGVRPTNRKEVATYLRNIAALIGPIDPTKSPLRVIGVDVDLAPLEGEGPSNGRKEILAALLELRYIAPVVLVAFNRSSNERHVRNAFMREAGCGSTEPFVPADRQHPHALYFATPAIFTARNEVPLRYPEELSKTSLHQESGKESGKRSGETEWPLVFPSLGALMHLAAKDKVNDEEKASLEALCHQAFSGSDAAVLQDHFGETEAGLKMVADIRKAYEERMYNWRLLDHSRTNLRMVDRTEDLVDGTNDDAYQTAKLEQLHEQLVASEGVILSIASGGYNDRYYVPYAYRDWVSGATVHAMEMISRARPVDEESPVALGFDLLVGLLFIGATSLAIPFLERVIDVVPTFGGVVLSILPLLVAAPLVVLSVDFCSAQLESEPTRWCNPFLVIIGLAIHAYLEGRGGHAQGEHRQSVASSLSFRLDRAMQQWHHWRYHAKGLHAAARLFDGIASVVVCWVVWLFALDYLFHQHDAVFKVGAAIAFVVTLGAAGAVLHQRHGREFA